MRSFGVPKLLDGTTVILKGEVHSVSTSSDCKGVSGVRVCVQTCIRTVRRIQVRVTVEVLSISDTRRVV